MYDLVEAVKEEKVVAILRGVPFEKMESVIRSLYDGGIRILEITFDQKSPNKHEELARSVKLAKELFSDMHVGSGTTMSVEEVETAYHAGAEFILAPNMNEKVIRRAVELGMLAVPGAMTPTEIALAYEYGAGIVKVFPAGNLGISYIKAIKAPISHIPLMAVGGVELDNLRDFFEAGVCSVGIGSSLTNKKMIDHNEWDQLTDLARRYVEAAKCNQAI